MLSPLLEDLKTGTKRYRIIKRIAEGRAFDILTAQDTFSEQKVIIKSIRYDLEASIAVQQERRALLFAELDVRNLSNELIPKAIEIISVENSELAEQHQELAEEPLLILEHSEGEPLNNWIATHHPTGIEPEKALKIVQKLAVGLQNLHENNLIFRALSPEHILVDSEEQLTWTGIGNIGEIHAPSTQTKKCTVFNYSAPEIIDDTSGRYQVPSADIFSLGGILSFLLTGEHPTGSADSPLRAEAFERLQKIHEGFGLLIAHMMQPLQAARFENIKTLMPWLLPKNLPSRKNAEFESLHLMEPWRKNAHYESKLSNGPLVTRETASKKENTKENTKENNDLQETLSSEQSEKQKKFRQIVMIAMFLFTLLVVFERLVR